MKKEGILGVGVATLDIYPGQNRMYPGGNEYNVVCNAAQLGMRAGFLGVFADDKAGSLLEETLHRLGVSTEGSHYEHGSSGYSFVQLKPDGDRVFLDWNREGVTDRFPITFTEEELRYAQSYAVISIGRLSTVTPQRQQRLYDRGCEICYDFHAAFTDADIDRIAPMTTYAFFSCSHLTTEEIVGVLRRAVDKGSKIAVGTRGVDSVLAWDGSCLYEQSTFPVEPLDTLGAGDSYIAAFLTAYLTRPEMPEEARIAQALEAAARHSARVVCTEGSIGVGYPLEHGVVDAPIPSLM